MGRITQVIRYGWKHAGQIADSGSTSKSRIGLLFDILVCYLRYRMWSNQYLNEKFYALDKNTRRAIGSEYRKNGELRDRWQQDFRENRKFLIRYTHIKYERAAAKELTHHATTPVRGLWLSTM